VLLAADGREAIHVFERSPEISIVLTDLVMPNQEGIDAIRAMRRRRPEVVIVAMSGAFHGQFLPVAKALGADATLSKPFTLDVLRQTLALAGAPLAGQP
jgi:CheY-like chemotaxis protein